MQNVLAEAASKLPALTQSSEYPALLEQLILEALCQLADQKVSVKGVAGQETVTKKALAAATPKFTKWATDNKGAEWASSISVTFDSQSLKSGIGGVEVTGFEGKITLSNTLQSRLMLAYETQLPTLRGKLFG